MEETRTRLLVERIGKSFDTPAGPLPVLRDVSFGLSGGETLAVVGPSGSGKSTLLNILGSLDRPSSGSVTLDGESVTALPDRDLPSFRARSVGFVFQDHHLLPQCTALENVLVPTLACDAPRTAGARQRGETLLVRVGLRERLHAFPSELSGGERQRVAVARALINAPGLLLADEPTGSLDRHSSAGVADLLLELAAETAMMLVLVTHDLALAARLARRAELREGTLREGTHGAAAR